MRAPTGDELLPPLRRSPSLEEGGLGGFAGQSLRPCRRLDIGALRSPSRALQKGCCYNVGDERARNARPYRVRRCSRRLQTHLTVAMIKPSVANASHRCDFRHVVGALIARPSTLFKPSIFPPQRPPSSREGDRPVGGGRSKQAVEGVRASRARRYPANFRFPYPQRPPSSREGDRPVGGGRRSQAVEGVRNPAGRDFSLGGVS